MDGCGLVLMCQSIPLHATNPSKLRSIQYIMYFAKLKQSGEQEEPLFMALIVKENLPLSTHRRPYLRFSEEARGPSGQSQLQPAQMRIDCSLESDYSPDQELETDGKDRSDLVLFQFLLTPKVQWLASFTRALPVPLTIPPSLKIRSSNSFSLLRSWA